MNNIILYILRLFGAWELIATSKKLTETFIEKHKDKVNWYHISICQKLTETIIEKHKDKVNKKEQLKSHHDKRTKKEKYNDAKKYADIHNLKINKTYLYAYRNHDQHGRGSFNKTITYKKGIYYRDWHCDLDKDNENSFGLGIWPEGNTKVKVKITDWGIGDVDTNGKARVWAFEII